LIDCKLCDFLYVRPFGRRRERDQIDVKLAFWEFGIPDWDAEELARQAAVLGYQGVDLRVRPTDEGPAQGAGLTLDSTAESLSSLSAAFAAAHVEVSSLLCPLGSPSRGDDQAWVSIDNVVVECAQLAQAVGATRLIFAGGVGNPPSGATWEAFLADVWGSIGRSLDAVPGVSVLLMNHRGRASAGQLLAAAARSRDSRIGVALGPDHALVMQENVLELIDAYAPLIQHVCFADRRVVRDDDFARYDGRYYHVRYESCLYGEGMVPAEAIMSALAGHNFDGYISLKWERSAHSDLHLPDGELALAGFPAFIRGLTDAVPSSEADLERA
jgi:sugar phosphate isomerase/epimerase